MVKWMTIVFGSVPILGWLLSLLVDNWLAAGSPTVHRMEGIPLLFATLPCLLIWNFLGFQLLQGPHVVIEIFYVLFCVILYALAGCLLGRLVRLCATWNRTQ